MAKEDKPDKFKGATVIMINDAILDPAHKCYGNGYEPGDIVTFVLDDKDLGNLDYTTDHFDAIYIKGLTRETILSMKERHTQNGRFIGRRKFKIDNKHVKVKDKKVLSKADFETPGVIVTKEIPEAPRPPVIEF